MSKKLKNSKNTTTLVNLVIEELENKNFDLEVLQKIQGEFSTAGKKEQREDFITAIGKLSNKQLHKLNRAVVENANELMPSNDPNFVCRTANNKIFHELFLLEARNCGMKAKFNIKKELQPLNVKDIPQEILNHYFILEQKFYPQRSSKDSIDSRIAQRLIFYYMLPSFENQSYIHK